MTEGTHTLTPAIRTSSRGFTLIEMLVVVAVIVIITATVLANNNKFGGVVQLQNLAYDIALSTREAQVYGVSTLHFHSTFNSPFGVHYDLSSPLQYTIFADAVNTNGVYDSGENLQTTNITRGYQISQLCVTPNGGSEDCTATKLDITYQHPEPDAYIRANGQATLYRAARIVVSSPRGDTMSVSLDSNGEISVGQGTSGN